MKGRLSGVVTAIGAVIIVLAAGANTGTAAQPDTTSANAAIAYTKAHQNPDGGFPAFGTNSAPGATLDAIFAIVAANGDPASITSGGNSPISYLETQAAGVAGDPGAAAKLTLGLAVSGIDPAAFGGQNLFNVMAGSYNATTGAYGVDLFDEALHILALSAAGQPVPNGVLSHLKSVQLQNGSWEFSAGFGGDTNTTALVIQALIGAGTPPGDSSVRDGLAYLATAQNSDGGFGFAPGSESDASSMGFVIQALIAAGEDIDAGGPWASKAALPLDALISQQNPATGAFQFGGEDSIFSTYQAVPGVMLAPFPNLETMSDGAQLPSPTATPAVSPSAAPAVTSPAPSPLAAVAAPIQPAQLPASGGPVDHRDTGTIFLYLVVALELAIVGVAGLRRWRRR